MSSLIKLSMAFFSALLLAGCMTPAGAHRLTMVLNAGADLPPEMWGRNVVAWVNFDEAPAHEYNRHSQVVLYSQGAPQGSEIYRMRIARVSLNHYNGNIRFPDGTHPFWTAALVPDHLPPLKAGDPTPRQTPPFMAVRPVSLWDRAGKESGLQAAARCLCLEPNWLFLMM